MSKDNLVICDRCGSNACYQTDLGADYKVSMCYGCGFTTNTLMHTDSKFLEEQLEVLPEIYKDLIFEDANGYHWMPSTINNTEQGMIYVNGTSVDDWEWAACPAIELSEEEQHRFPEGATHKMDMQNVKFFKERDFIEALDYIGVFEPKN